MVNRKNLWNGALLAGLVLAGVSIAYMFATQYCKVGIVNFLLWIAKLAGCIILFRFLMKKFLQIEAEASRPDLFAFGAVAAVASALLYAGCYFVNAVYIAPDLISEAMETALEAYSSSMTSEVEELLEEMIPRLPMIGFWANLLYCSVFGVVLSAIFSRSLVPSNPFKNE